MRVQSEHWANILDFCEQYPQIITNKFNGQGGRNELNDLWRTLTIKLNALGYGEKTVEGWKKTITDWKSKTKAKAGTISTYSSQTGGGEQCHLILTTYEERLLAIMGKTSYEGNPVNLERGFRKRKLFDESRDAEVAAVHKYTTTTLDHTYPISSPMPTASISQSDVVADYELPVANETIVMAHYDPESIIRPTQLYRTLLPSVHSPQIPSTSQQIFTSPKINSNLDTLNTSLPKNTSIPHSPTISSPSISRISNKKPLDLTPVHLGYQENTPQKQNVQCDRRRKRSNNSNAEQLQKMHIELLDELKNININAASMAESLKIIANSFKR